MVSTEDDISPASLPTREFLTWDNNKKASNTTLISEDVMSWNTSGGYRYCKSEQTFESGFHRFEVEVDWDNKEAQISFGVCWDENFNCDGGVYYFTGAYLYCNYYPSFTKDYSNIHTTTPPKATNLSTVAVNFDFDERKIWWEINGEECEKLDFSPTSGKVFVVCGMFSGKATFK